MKPEDRRSILDLMHSTRDEFLGSLSGISESVAIRNRSRKGGR